MVLFRARWCASLSVGNHNLFCSLNFRVLRLILNPLPPPPPLCLPSDGGSDFDARADDRQLPDVTSSPSSNNTATPNATDPPPLTFWLGLTAAVSIITGALLLLSLRRRRQSLRKSSGVELMGESLNDALLSGDMGLEDGSYGQHSDGIRLTPVSPMATVPRDAQNLDRIRTTLPPDVRDLDGVSPSSLQLLLRETAAPAFIG